MAKKKSNTVLSVDASRDLTITMESTAGTINLFYAFVNGVKVIQHDATKKRSWTGAIPDSQVHLKIRVVGIGQATFKLLIDLPGTANDQSLTLTLKGGYYEAEFIL